MLTRTGITLTAVLLFSMLAACGQKGPLYLPGDPTKMRSEVPQQPAAGQSTESEDDEDKDDDSSQ